jgi:hypothetical protein
MYNSLLQSTMRAICGHSLNQNIGVQNEVLNTVCIEVVMPSLLVLLGHFFILNYNKCMFQYSLFPF